MRHLLLSAGFAVCALLGACGGKPTDSTTAPVAENVAPGDPSAVKDSGPVIVMLGDSLTAGYNLPAGNALPAALQRQFDAQGIKAKFVNAGVSGDTTADGLNRYDWSVTGTGAKLLVVALGANDFLSDLAPETPKKNLAAILAKAKAQNLPAALIGVALPGESRDKREAAYAAIYPELAKEFGVPYFPNMMGAIAGKANLLQQDGLHPTEEGVEAMAADIAGFLAPVVKNLP